MGNNKDTFLASINPTLKLMTHLMIMFILMSSMSALFTLIILLISFVTGIFLAKWDYTYFRKNIFPYFLFALLVFWSMAAFGEGTHILWQWGWFRVSTESMQHGLVLAERAMAFILIGLLFISTTNVTDLVMSFIHQCKMPPKWGYGLLAGIRFIPDFQTELKEVVQAHKVRGYIKYNKLRQFVHYLLPLLTRGIRKAERTAVAIEARGFQEGQKRTFYKQTMVKKKDWLYMLTGICTVLLLRFLFV
ncbi:energy-coupling factor transporter transmembrane component T family protein [Listeria aquatica]|uniref:energy-coupling factor transporter transmembrane component T family protein n=1 Tax=Listeria aquatica TaxID=1494960 RepID=UPI001FD207DA|nr:energy-coupling factor transporter transmembrane component T [Listeria aquatica]